MKTKVWILNHYAGSMLFDRGGRHYAFAKYLRRMGYAPTVFCCNAWNSAPRRHIETEKLWCVRQAEEIDVPFVYVRGRIYSGNGKQRVLNMLDFYFNVQKAAKEYAKQYGKPDVIFASSVHPLTLVAGLRLAKHFGVECVCEVRDLWPESIVVYSSRLTRSNPLIRLLYRGEKWIYKKADRLVFTMEGAYEYISDRGWESAISQDKVYPINNGVDREDFETNRESYPAQDAELDDESLFKVVYTGSIRKANNLGMLLDAADKLRGLPVKFLIWGDGDEREMLERRARDTGLDSVVFKGRVEKTHVPAIIAKSDVNYLDVFADEIARYGISPNKLFEYVAAGRPILMPYNGKYDPLAAYSCGVLCAPDADGVAQGIKTLMEETADMRQQRAASAERAAAYYDYKNLSRMLADILEGSRA